MRISLSLYIELDSSVERSRNHSRTLAGIPVKVNNYEPVTLFVQILGANMAIADFNLNLEPEGT